MSRRGSRTRLVAIWTVLGALLGVIVYAERADLVGLWSSTDDGHGHNAGSRDLVPIPVEQLGAVEVVYQGTVHRFERDAQKLWFYHGVHAPQQGTHAHQTDPAAAERIDKAFAAFTRARIERRFPMDFAALGRSQAERTLAADDSVRDYGVTVPSMLVLFYLPGQIEPAARYAIGDVAPDTYSRYVQRLGTTEVVTIANYQIQNLQQLIGAMVAAAGQPAAASPPAAAPGPTPVKSN
jgi:hypothetical protein